MASPHHQHLARSPHHPSPLSPRHASVSASSSSSSSGKPVSLLQRTASASNRSPSGLSPSGGSSSGPPRESNGSHAVSPAANGPLYQVPSSFPLNTAPQASANPLAAPSPGSLPRPQTGGSAGASTDAFTRGSMSQSPGPNLSASLNSSTFSGTPSSSSLQRPPMRDTLSDGTTNASVAFTSPFRSAGSSASSQVPPGLPHTSSSSSIGSVGSVGQDASSGGGPGVTLARPAHHKTAGGSQLSPAVLPALLEPPSAESPIGYSDQRTSLLVLNLPLKVRWQDIKDLFRRSAGTVLRADIALTPDGRSRGFGSVLMRDAEDARRAKQCFDGFEWMGRRLEIHTEAKRGGGWELMSEDEQPFSYPSTDVDLVSSSPRDRPSQLPTPPTFSVSPSPNLGDAGVARGANASPSLFDGGSKPTRASFAVPQQENAAGDRLLPPFPGAAVPFRESRSASFAAFSSSMRSPTPESVSGQGARLQAQQGGGYHLPQPSSLRSTTPTLPSPQVQSLRASVSGGSRRPSVQQQPHNTPHAGLPGAQGNSPATLPAPPFPPAAPSPSLQPNLASGGIPNQHQLAVLSAQASQAAVAAQQARILAEYGGMPDGSFYGRTLFVGNLSYATQWQDLKDLFRSAGNILRADIALGSEGRSRGFGTALFGTKDEAARAVRMFHGYDHNGRTLKVHFDRFARMEAPPPGILVPPRAEDYTSAFSAAQPPSNVGSGGMKATNGGSIGGSGVSPSLLLQQQQLQVLLQQQQQQQMQQMPQFPNQQGMPGNFGSYNGYPQYQQSFGQGPGLARQQHHQQQQQQFHPGHPRQSQAQQAQSWGSQAGYPSPSIGAFGPPSAGTPPVATFDHRQHGPPSLVQRDSDRKASKLSVVATNSPSGEHDSPQAETGAEGAGAEEAQAEEGKEQHTDSGEDKGSSAPSSRPGKISLPSPPSLPSHFAGYQSFGAVGGGHAQGRAPMPMTPGVPLTPGFHLGSVPPPTPPAFVAPMMSPDLPGVPNPGMPGYHAQHLHQMMTTPGGEAPPTPWQYPGMSAAPGTQFRMTPQGAGPAGGRGNTPGAPFNPFYGASSAGMPQTPHWGQPPRPQQNQRRQGGSRHGGEVGSGRSAYGGGSHLPSAATSDVPSELTSVAEQPRSAGLPNESAVSSRSASPAVHPANEAQARSNPSEGYPFPSVAADVPSGSHQYGNADASATDKKLSANPHPSTMNRRASTNTPLLSPGQHTAGGSSFGYFASAFAGDSQHAGEAVGHSSTRQRRPSLDADVLRTPMRTEEQVGGHSYFPPVIDSSQSEHSPGASRMNGTSNGGPGPAKKALSPLVDIAAGGAAPNTEDMARAIAKMSIEGKALLKRGNSNQGRKDKETS